MCGDVGPISAVGHPGSMGGARGSGRGGGGGAAEREALEKKLFAMRVATEHAEQV